MYQSQDVELQRKSLVVTILKFSRRYYAFLRSIFPLPSRTLHSLLHTIQFKTGMNAHVFSILKDILETMCDKVRMCCLMLNEMSIRSLTVLEALRTSEATAGQEILHIKHWCSCCMVYIKIRRNQLLST